MAADPLAWLFEVTAGLPAAPARPARDSLPARLEELADAHRVFLDAVEYKLHHSPDQEPELVVRFHCVMANVPRLKDECEQLGAHEWQVQSDGSGTCLTARFYMGGDFE